MSKQTFLSDLAIAGLISASAMAAVPQLAVAQVAARYVHPLPVWSVTCADGSVKSVSSGVRPSGAGVCAAIGYNGGAITSGSTTAESAVRPDALTKDALVAQEAGPISTPVLVSSASAAQADAVRSDPPGLPVTPGMPVLNCSQSPNHPALVDLSTAPSGYTLKSPSGTVTSKAALSHVSWSLVPGSQWIGPVGGQTNAATGVWTYTQQVRINPCPKGKAAVLTVAYRADNAATFKLFQGSTLITSKAQGGTPNYGFLPASLTNHSYTFPVGANGVYTVVFEVRNSSGPSGLSGMVRLAR